MNYSIEVSERFEKEFKKLDKYTQKMIKAWIEKNLSNTDIYTLMVKAIRIYMFL